MLKFNVKEWTDEISVSGHACQWNCLVFAVIVVSFFTLQPRSAVLQFFIQK